MADKLNQMLADVEHELRNKYSELKALDQNIHARRLTLAELDARLAKVQPELAIKEPKLAKMKKDVAEWLAALERFESPSL
jgi:septal ring factor EnvC (AmiA/AmiB activator)